MQKHNQLISYFHCRRKQRVLLHISKKHNGIVEVSFVVVRCEIDPKQTANLVNVQDTGSNL